MRKLLLLVTTFMITLSAYADEGMWLLPYLQKMNIKDMKAKGCKLSAEDIYSVNKSALKDAIIIFGGGCTGEIVSSEGLILTNHHCGFGAIQAASSVEHDYLKNGFWAKDYAEEIPSPGLKARFVRSIADVTTEVLSNIPSIAAGKERDSMVTVNTRALVKELERQNPDMEVEVVPFFGGNQYFSFVFETFTDVRLVGTPPSSIGKFGGDTDNWMWPRHTGDFSVFRIYSSKDNKPAAYSADNVPYKPIKHLKISLDGYKEGDFAMIMGFPGSTERYMTSYEIDNFLNSSSPTRVLIRGERQDILKRDMEASDKVRIQYASKYASSSNYWKNSIGMARGLRKLDIKSKKEAQERLFQEWANANTLPEEGFIDALSMIKESEMTSVDIARQRQWIQEAILRAIELIAIPQHLNRTPKDKYQALATKFYKDYNASTDKKVAKRMLTIFRENNTTLPSFYADEIDAKFGGSIDAYVDYLYDNSVFADEQKCRTFLTDFDKEAFKQDPAYIFMSSVFARYMQLTKELSATGAYAKFNDGHRLYIAGLMRMMPDKAWASDANSTIRLTYGQVLPYNPADGITYNYYTTLDGVIAKEDKSNPTEFTVPEPLKELYAKKDYGRYADKNGKLPVAFLANCDITGGNSGSPIMNAKGELLGLAFDGNWEAMSGDIAFEPELQRTISVDVRYVLFIIDKYAGADRLIREMDIVGGAKK